MINTIFIQTIPLLQIVLPTAEAAQSVEANFFGWAIILLVFGMSGLFYALMKVNASRHEDLLKVVRDTMQSDNSVKEILVQQSSLLSAQGETMKEMLRTLQDLNVKIERTNAK